MHGPLFAVNVFRASADEWKLYKVPFTDRLQQGWAAESPYLDLTAAPVVRFT